MENQEEEIWKKIKGNELYLISNYGRIKSVPHIVNGRNKKQVLNSKANCILKSRLVGNHLIIHLGSGKNRKKHKISVLVYEAFKKKLKENMFEVYLDGNNLNCHYKNISFKSAFTINKVKKRFFVPIKGFERYYINKKGIVINTENANKVAWVYSIANKCMAVRLWSNNTTKLIYLYRLLAISFIPNPKNKPQVNHLDGDRMNLKLSNLEWNTASENMKHAFINGFTGGTFQKGINNRTRHLNK